MKDLLGRSWPHRSRCGCVASIEGRCYCRNPGRPPAVLTVAQPFNARL